MKKNTYPHLRFLSENNIKKNTLPADLQKRISGFDLLFDDLDDALREDRSMLLEKLGDLSLEIEDELYEEFEDRLENNDEVSSPEDTDSPEALSVMGQVHGVHDEKILATLYLKGVRHMSRTDLRKEGYKGSLERHVAQVGAFELRKKMFSYSYKIKRRN